MPRPKLSESLTSIARIAGLAGIALGVFGLAQAGQAQPEETPDEAASEAAKKRIEELPDEGECPTLHPEPSGDGPVTDATPLVLKEGMVLIKEDLMALRQLIPQELWRHREVFFFEGMRMVVGACHRRYPPSSAYRQATERFAGSARVDEDGNLLGYQAGLPFPPGAIDLEQPGAAARWAWNVQTRFRGAGPRGNFRIVDLPPSIGQPITYEGDFFLLRATHRSDRADQDYRVPEVSDETWVSGGEIDEPFDARHLAWRQFRPEKAVERYEQADDIFVYVPTMRKMRRSASTWVDGIFFPRYSVAAEGSGGGVSFGNPMGGGGGGAINPTAGQSIAQSEHVRRGFVGMSFRPNAYQWRHRGTRDVLAPLNGSRPGYPEVKDRNYGTSGLSVASDRWDVRRAVVIEGMHKQDGRGVRFLTIWVDYQTQQPLYWITRTSRRRLVEVGILVHRYSGDLSEYPEWPGGYPANVFEPAGAVFYNALEGGGGWRRESYDTVSIPYTDKQRRRLTSSERLDRGH